MDFDEAHWSDDHNAEPLGSLRGYAALSRDETAEKFSDQDDVEIKETKNVTKQQSRDPDRDKRYQARLRTQNRPNIKSRYAEQNDDAAQYIHDSGSALKNEAIEAREKGYISKRNDFEEKEASRRRSMQSRRSRSPRNYRQVEVNSDSSSSSYVLSAKAAAPRIQISQESPTLPLKLVRRRQDLDAIREMADELNALREENERLRAERGDQSVPTQPGVLAYTSRTFHQIDRTLYLDQPHWEPTEGNNVMLLASNPIRNVNYYLDQHPEVAFAIYKEYSIAMPADRGKIETKDGVYRTPEPSYEFISFVAPAMLSAIEAFVEKVPGFGDYSPYFDPYAPIQAPYLFMYYSLPFIDSVLPELDLTDRNLISQLQAAIDKGYGYEYESAKLQAEKGLVARHILKYLIRPGDVLVSGHRNSTQAYISLGWIESPESVTEDIQYEPWDYAGRKRIPRYGPLSKSTTGKKKITCTWEVQAWRWDYDGVFAREYCTLQIIMNIGYDEESVEITSLDNYPLKYASPEVRTLLEKRGKTFWSLRFKRFVSYMRSEDDELFNVHDRYMVDIRAYKKIYSSSSLARRRLLPDPSINMATTEPPTGDELLIFPPDIMAYNLQQKTWRKLLVDRIQDITWNKQAFKDLVAEPETKELIQALVMKQLVSKVSTDFVAGKGNGLIMLLHGAPGTGKTFTAEGVAEFAEKPLLRVTCGDVGTYAEDVDVRLRASLDIGRMWDCVVLLDEADVFLEERDMKDLNRNALVSVFLRAIEYYEGILILTSNRVGTFDEAFKSRIQLALHYENLGVSQRRKIWRNFMERIRLVGAEESQADVEDILDHINDLSKEVMNGREIRNSITIARQLAQFRGEPFQYSHLKHVIGVSAKFGKYLKDLRGMTDDDIKQDTGLRLSYTIADAPHT